ncbi:MAG TPA: lysophospholipid acyltransferase family protein [Anaerolineales bacterium]|nr:lysophospholipid acyltransferase family protein [Anaerolineales bacterium]
MLYKIIGQIVKMGTRILCRIDAPDLDKVPMRGPLIAYSNHTGQIEVAVFFGQLQPRPITGWAKMEAWDNAFLNWLFNLWGLIPVRRGEADTTALRKAVTALEKGYIFGIAPEGTRNITGRLKRAHPGAVLLAVRSGAPLLPIVHWGGEDFLRNLSRLKRTDFHIRVGDPICLKVDGVRLTREIRQQIVDEMMYRLAELLPHEYRGKYEKVTEVKYSFTEECKISQADLA